MKRIALALGCLWGVSAWAQESFVFSRADGGSPRAIYVGPGTCAETLQLQWTYTRPISGTPNDSLQIWATAWTPDTACGDIPGNDDQLLTSVTWPTIVSAHTGAFELPLTRLPMFDGGSCPATSSTNPATMICASMPYIQSGTVGGQTKYANGAGFIIYDADPPPAPVIRSAVGKDREVEVEFVPPWEIDFSAADAQFIALEVRAPSAADFQRMASVSVSETKLTASNLINGVEYRVRLVAIDGAGNESAPSSEVAVTPVAPQTDAGVPDSGDEPKQGCTTAPGLFAALAALWLRRRTN